VFMQGTGGNFFGACFAWGGLSTDHVMRSMALFTHDVIPGFHMEEATA
jgi:hypothetical protein